MDVLRPWLGLAVQCELDAVLQWRRRAVDSAQPQAVGEVAYEDDGSNLRVTSSRIGLIQIIEFQTYEKPIQAVISDSQTSIQATFADSAVSKYTAATRKRITDGTKGGLVQIRAFEIVATHFGPKKSRLTLLIKDFQSLGSDGSGIFGNPRPIGSRQDIMIPLIQLEELRAQEPISSQPQSDLEDDAGALDIRSQASDDPSDDEAGNATQAAFATQALGSEVNTTRRSVLREPPEGTRGKHATTSNSPLQKPSVNLSRSATGPSGNAKVLLGLLDRSSRSGRAPTSNGTAESSEIQGLSTAFGQGFESTVNAADKKKPALSLSLSQIGAPEQNWISGTTHDTTKPVEGMMAKQPEHTTSTQSPGPVKRRLDMDIQAPNPVSSNIHSPADEVVPIIHGSKTEVLVDGPNRDIFNASEKHSSPGQDGTPLKLFENANNVEDHPWKGMTKISRRDVTIAKDQQALLHKQDSWLPPEPGHRGPFANVPIAVLQSLNMLAERRASQAKRPKKSTQLSESPDSRFVKEIAQESLSSDYGIEEEEETDLPVSSSEWPPSSPPTLSKRDELPPDSSRASPEPRATRYTADAPDTPGRASSVPSHNGKFSPPHNAPTQNQSLDSLPQPSQFPGQQHLKRDQRNVASINGSQQVPTQRPLTQTSTGDILQDQSWAYQLESAARAEMIPQRPSRGAPLQSRAVSRDVNLNKRNAPLTSLSAGDTIDLLSEDDEMSDSDKSWLETSVPLALNAQPNDVYTDPGTRTVSSHAYPSTASQQTKPALQVKRTPNMNGQVSKQTISQLTSDALHVTRGNDLCLESKQAGDLSDNGESSDPIIPGTFDAQLITLEDGRDNAMLDFNVRDNHNATDDDDDEALVNQQIRSEVDAHSLRSASFSPVKHSLASSYQSLAQPLEALHATGQVAIQAVFPMSPLKATADTKRKAEEPGVLSPNVTKRRKRFKHPPRFNSNQDGQEIQDPAVLARQQRREFFASRRGSVLQSNVVSSIEVHEVEALEAEDISNDLSEASKEDEDVGLISDHQLDLDSGMSQIHGVASGQEPTKFKTLQARNSPVRRPDMPGATLTINRSTPSESVGAYSAKPSEISTSASSTAGNVYDRFLAAYPEYTGDLKHCIAIVKKINILFKEDRMEHQSLWDDFIVRHKMEYRQYLLDCSEKAEDPLPYEKYYRSEIDEPKFTKRVITPNNLAEVLVLEGYISSTVLQRRSSVERGAALKSGNAVSTPTIGAAAVDSVRIPQQVRSVIDLTTDSQVHQSKTEPKTSTPGGSAKKTPRPLPWAKPDLDSEISPPARQKGTPGSAESSRSRPLSHAFQTSLKAPLSASRSPLRPRYIDSDPPPSAAKAVTAVGPKRSTAIPKNSRSRIAPQDRSSVTDWLDGTSPPTEANERAPPSTAEWWTDVNTPFKGFARAYASIESGKGNSFAEAGVSGHKKLGKVDAEGLVWPSEKGLNALGWKL